jgi:hypothetical protein
MQPLKLLKYLRKYDGRADSSEFMSRLEGDLNDHHVSFEWIINNFDRVLEGEAKAWYASVSPKIRVQVTQANADYAVLWRNLQQQFLLFFDHTSLRNTHKEANRKLKFEVGDDPQSYVTAKLEVLRYIDPHMEDLRLVENLVKGIPLQLQVQMVASETKTPRAFLDQLRKISELLSRSGVNNSKSLYNSTHSFYSAPLLAETQIKQPTTQNQEKSHNNNNNTSTQVRIPSQMYVNSSYHAQPQQQMIFGQPRFQPQYQQPRFQPQYQQPRFQPQYQQPRFQPQYQQPRYQPPYQPRYQPQQWRPPNPNYPRFTTPQQQYSSGLNPNIPSMQQYTVEQQQPPPLMSLGTAVNYYYGEEDEVLINQQRSGNE